MLSGLMGAPNWENGIHANLSFPQAENAKKH
jgi:hypothetical protein